MSTPPACQFSRFFVTLDMVSECSVSSLTVGSPPVGLVCPSPTSLALTMLSLLSAHDSTASPLGLLVAGPSTWNTWFPIIPRTCVSLSIFAALSALCGRSFLGLKSLFLCHSPLYFSWHIFMSAFPTGKIGFSRSRTLFVLFSSTSPEPQTILEAVVGWRWSSLDQACQAIPGSLAIFRSFSLSPEFQFHRFPAFL